MAIKFTTEEVSKFIDANCHETRQKWAEFSKDELFIPRLNQSLREQKDFALKRLEVIAKNKVFSVYDFLNNPLNVFANHEMAAYIDPSMATKLTVQLNLFGGTLAILGTERHKYIADGVDSLSTIGCFALTELGFGNNAVQMETTAEYDPETSEFVIHSPTVLSQKYWITNGAYHCNYAVVFAQLIMPGNKKEGVHVFLVKIRDEDKSIRKGIFIEDMGAKFGNNGVDNGRLKFDSVRIPRENLLNRFSDVFEDGTFVSKINGKRDRFLKVADRLLSGRLCISSMCISATKFALNIAVRFAKQRLAMGPTGLSDTPIGDLGLFQNQVYPLLARTLTLNIAFNHAKDLYSQSQLQKQEVTAFLVCVCCTMKPLISWNARDVGTTLVERIGGQGYLSCNRVHELISSAHSGITAEGDNNVLFQKVAKEIMILVSKKTYEFPSPSKTQQALRTHNHANKDFGIQDMMDLLVHKELFMIDKIGKVVIQKLGAGMTQYEILMKEDNDIVQDLARSFGERIVSQFCFGELKKAKQNIRDLFTQYFSLHLNAVICRELAWYIVNNFLSLEGAKRLQETLKENVVKIHPYALVTLNSLGIPEHLLNAPISQDYVKFNNVPNEGELFRAKL